MSPVGVARPARVFYGWWVALAFVILEFLTTGVRFTGGPPTRAASRRRRPVKDLRRMRSEPPTRDVALLLE
jgi:hypothetical protein